MGLFGFIKGQFIEVIEATDFSKDLMVFQSRSTITKSKWVRS